MALDFLFQVVHLVIIMAAQQDDVPSGQIGVMAAMFGVGGLLGAPPPPGSTGASGSATRY
ncbi:hypothetical protein [Streptomyces koyangensis]|uniref:hypothetical protein n=1 Tax=Streptomyces koyangensis TaxID=188770 RepID=UPI0034522196